MPLTDIESKIRWAERMLAITHGLTPEECGVFAVLWSIGPHAIPNDDVWLARQCNCSAARFSRIKLQLVAKGKLLIDGDAIHIQACVQ